MKNIYFEYYLDDPEFDERYLQSEGIESAIGTGLVGVGSYIAGKTNQPDKAATAYTDLKNTSAAAANTVSNTASSIKSTLSNKGVQLMGAAAMGAILATLYSKYRNKNLTCDSIKDVRLKNKCNVNILDGLIQQLKSSASECNRTPDPAQCKLEIMEKIEKLEQKKDVLMRQTGRVNKAKVSNNEDEL